MTEESFFLDIKELSNPNSELGKSKMGKAY
jgi:hypothetical protein